MRIKKLQGDANEKTELRSDGAAVAPIPHPIATMGQVFSDGSMVELIRGNQHSAPELWLSAAEKEIRGARVSYKGQEYEPARIDRTLLQHLTLPTKCGAHRSTDELFTGVCHVITNFVGLNEKCTDIAGRIVLGSAVLEAMRIAPGLVLAGPDVERGDQFMTVLRCLCRHALPLTGITPASFRSLPSGAGFTFLVSQPTVGPSLQNLFDAASQRDQKIPSRGGLLDLFGLQVIRSDSFLEGDGWPHRSIKIPMIPAGRALPQFDAETQDRIASEFQAKLLDFRRAKLSAACALKFDASEFDPALRDVARSLAASTPDAPDLRAEVFNLLREQNTEICLGRWIDPNVIAAEAVLVGCDGSLGGSMYISELSKIAEATLTGRGEKAVTIDAGTFGKRLRSLGFVPEARDAKGVKLRLTDEVRNHALSLARDLGAPEIESGKAGNAGMAK